MRNHTRVVQGLAVGAALTGLLTSSVSAATMQVRATDNRTFSPGTVTRTVGDSTVHWSPTGTDDHSVHQGTLASVGLFDSGAPAPGLNFTRVFSAGTFAYQCEEHGPAGMRGTVRVAPQVLGAPAGLRFTVRWARATGALQTGNRFDVQYRVGVGAWKKWFTNSTVRSKVFGSNASPVRVVRGKKYSFRVVSRTGTVNSALSPVKSFTAR